MSDNPSFQQANQAANEVVNLSQAGANLESQLRSAVTDRVKNNPLYQQRDQAAQNFISSGPQIRADLAKTVQGTPLSPSQQSAIESSRRASSVIPLLSLNDLVGGLTGGIENAVKGGLGAFDSLFNASASRAKLLQQQAQDQYDRQIAERELALREATANKANQPSLLEQILMAQMQPQQDFIGPPGPPEGYQNPLELPGSFRLDPGQESGSAQLNVSPSGQPSFFQKVSNFASPIVRTLQNGPLGFLTGWGR